MLSEILQGCFSKIGNLSLQIVHQLESKSISFLLGQRNGFEPDQLFSLTAFLHTFVYNQYKKRCLTAGLTINNIRYHLDIQPKYQVILYLQAGQ
jgi:hypothetical protein